MIRSDIVLRTYFKKHKKFLIVFGMLLCLFVISGPLFRTFGRRLIEDIYYGRTVPFLNGLIEDQSRRPLEVYLAYGDTFFKQFRGYFLSLLFLFGIYFLSTLVPAIRNKKVQNTVILFLAILTIFGLTELFLRYLMPVQLGEITFAHYQPSANPRIVIEPRPSSGGFNSSGFRDREYPKKKPEGVYRIIVIGDSLAYGLRVDREETYAKKLEKKLNAHSGNGKKYEVINMGVPGYRTTQIIARLEEKGLAYDPDMIIYGYWLDDISFSGLVPFYFSRTNLDMSEKVHRLMAGNPVERKIKKLLLDSQIFRRGILLAREFQRRRAGEKITSAIFPVGEKIKELDPAVRDLYQEYREKLARGTYADAAGGEPTSPAMPMSMTSCYGTAG